MRILFFIATSIAILQVSWSASMSSAIDSLEPLLRELSEEQKIELIENLLREEHEKRAQADEMPPYETVIGDLFQQSLEKLRANAQTRGVSQEREPERRLAEYLRETPSIQVKGRNARAHLDALRAYKNQWQRKRGLDSSNEEFLVEIRQRQRRPNNGGNNNNNGGNNNGGNNNGGTGNGNGGNPLYPLIADVTRGPDQIITLNDTVCTRLTVDCRGHENYRYRFFDGSCNNLENGKTDWGGIDRAFKRRLDEDYADGIFDPRVSSTNRPLPNARAVSIAINAASGISDDDLDRRNSPVNSLLMMQVGQFLDHDITHTPSQNVSCPCNETNDLSECFNIPLEAGHGFGSCIQFKRSTPILVDTCDLTYFEQGNTLTAWVDASQVYGGTAEEADELRDHTPASEFGRVHGRLSTRTNPASNKATDQLMPAEESCATSGDNCAFVAGDVRVNEQPGLASMHTIFVRLHNEFEKHIARHNPGMDGETLYQETRRLVVAVWQNIVYNEYLRVILGETTFNSYNLAANRTGYNPEVNPDIANEFATAAFRFGHTEVGDQIPFGDYTYNSAQTMNLDDGFFNVDSLYRCPIATMSGTDSVMLGMSEAHSEKYDSYFSDTLRNHLFGGGGDAPGMDLVALNIQRGRDHGIPGYGHALRYCTGQGPTARYLRQGDVRRTLLNLYGNGQSTDATLDNIDLFAAGVSETPLDDGQLGPTFSCLIGKQFQEVKDGDRFFYSHQQAGFTTEQVENIEQYTLASVLCDTMDDPDYMQEWALLKPWSGTMDASKDVGLAAIYGGKTNERKPCSELPKIDFRLFVRPSPSGK